MVPKNAKIIKPTRRTKCAPKNAPKKKPKKTKKRTNSQENVSNSSEQDYTLPDDNHLDSFDRFRSDEHRYVASIQIDKLRLVVSIFFFTNLLCFFYTVF